MFIESIKSLFRHFRTYTMTPRKVFLLCVSSNLIYIIAARQLSPQCHYMMKHKFAKCSSREEELKRYRNRKTNRLYNITTFNATSDFQIKTNDCSQTTICRKLFKTGRIYRRSLGTTIATHISEMLRRCCGNCTKFYQTNLLPGQDETNKTVVQEFHFVYPVYGISTVKSIQGMHFLPVLNFPSAYYVTLKKSEREVAVQMIMTCLEMWPLIVICLLMSIIAGFLIWILDTWTNEKQFPRSFLSGITEGAF